MSYAFSGELQQLVQSELAKGVYASEDELLLVALKVLREQEHAFQQFRAEVQGRIESLERGEGIELADEQALRSSPMGSKRRAGGPGSKPETPMSRFTLARGVRADLRGIWRHIAVENHGPDAADRLIDRITDVFALLAREPLLGEDEGRLGRRVRGFVVGPTWALWSGDIGVRVIQVVHAARDIATVFRRPRTR